LFTDPDLFFPTKRETMYICSHSTDLIERRLPFCASVSSHLMGF